LIANKIPKILVFATAIFLLFAITHCFIFTSRFPNRNIFFYTLYILYYLLLFGIVIFLSQKKMTIRRILISSLLFPYILSGIFGLVFYISTMSDINVKNWIYQELLLTVFLIPYISFGGILGTIPFAIVCFLSRIQQPR